MDQRSTAGVRQFEQTAVAKLVAEGVPQDVAYAFVHIGLPKSGRVQHIKDHVCKMKYEKFFIERSPADFKDPFRVGAIVPHIQENNMSKFYTTFSMSDIDAARFMKAFPEFEVVCRGRTYNQHAFYANKRYAETELLVHMVFQDAKKNSGLNPRSLIDFGGNDSWHEKKDRAFVHCDNPVLSARDLMRYTVRDVFSGSDRNKVCGKKFEECDVKADYAIAVHSTYDVSPKTIAYAMSKKNCKKFYGVINYIPGLESKPAGVYEADGVVMTVCRPTRAEHYVLCGFKHDPALEYRHRLSVLRKYLYVVKRYDFVTGDGESRSYTYRIRSVRGNAIIFEIVEGGAGFYSVDTHWTPPTKKLYHVSLQFLQVKRMEVDAEFYDRLVLQASGARNFKEYDIVSLFRYAKSLRQRVSINGIVLSSGFTYSPEQLVHIVIAAYATAAAYRVESAEFFKEASSQLINLRGRGFWRNVFRISALAIGAALLALPVVLAKAAKLDILNDRIKALVANKGSILVEVDKPHAGSGKKYNPDMLRPTTRYKVVRKEIFAGRTSTELTGKYRDAKKTGIFADCDGQPMCFNTRGVVAYDDAELPGPTTAPARYDFSSVAVGKEDSLEKQRELYYSRAMEVVYGTADWDKQLLVMPNADRLYRTGITKSDGYREQMGDNVKLIYQSTKFVVFRGVGKYAISLKPPKFYAKGNCVKFVLFYDSVVKFDEYKKKLEAKGYSTGVIFELPAESVTDVGSGISSEDWESVTGGTPTIVRFPPPNFVMEKLEQGEYYMSGALERGTPMTPPVYDAIQDNLVRDYVSPYCKTIPEETEESQASDGDSDVETVTDSTESSRDQGDEESVVSSSDVVPGREAMRELVVSYDMSTGVAVSTSKALIDLAVAMSSDGTVLGKFSAVAQGHPGNCMAVRVTGDVWQDVITKEDVPHMAVSDGEVVYDKLTNKPPDGIYVTSDVMRIYTGSAIKRSVESVESDKFTCEVVCVNGPAGSGKTHSIVHGAKKGDVVLCETSGALRHTARDLFRVVPGWTGHAFTVDSFLMHKPVRTCDVLWIDEAFRLHAGKIFAVVKLLSPRVVYCLGDTKQIPVLSFIPGFDFYHHRFPFTRQELRRDTWRMPADACFALSTVDYYAYHVVTHNPILRSFRAGVQYESGMFMSKPKSTVLLVYTQSVKEELLKSGVSTVMTIGESQGETFDDVILYRHSTLPLALFYDREQALVGVSRHRRSFVPVTVDTVMRDDSFVSKIVSYALGKGNELLFSSHAAEGVKPVADAAALDARKHAEGRQKFVEDVSTSEEDFSLVGSDVDDWAEYMAGQEESSFVS